MMQQERKKKLLSCSHVSYWRESYYKLNSKSQRHHFAALAIVCGFQRNYIFIVITSSTAVGVWLHLPFYREF